MPTIINLLLIIFIVILGLIKLSHPLENKHVWILIEWKLMNLNLTS